MEQHDPKITVAGVGAVGTLLAVMIGQKYAEGLSLIAHGKRAEALEKGGLVLHSEFYGERRAMPRNVVERGDTLPVQDFVVVCVKNYSLDQIAEQIRPCVGPDTVILPVMNGVEPGDRLRRLFPEAVVIDGLIYTVTGANPDYSATQIGGYTRLFVGSKLREERYIDGARRFVELMKSVGFTAIYSDEIETEIWQKYILNCAFNTVTARYLTNSGAMRRDEGMRADLKALTQEAAQVGFACGVKLPPDVAEAKFRFMVEEQAEAATSSMRRDVEAGRRTELDAFLGALLRKAEEFHVETPVARRYYEELKAIVKE